MAEIPDPSLPPIARLLRLMAQLRTPDQGCPWDLEQTFETIAPHTIEEAYEVADAIERGDLAHLKEELGDLLFQIVFYARIAEERDVWDFDAVADALVEKMIARHPHVFGDQVVETAAAMPDRWEATKAAERAAKAAAEGRRDSVLDGVVPGLPALTRAMKLQKRAARVGFDWTEADQILDKIEEEIGELRQVIAAGDGADRRQDELGDLLFALVNLGRRLEVDPDAALRHTNAKFERRFRMIETWLAEDGLTPDAVDLDRMEALWQRAKKRE
jgi:ATP diphosphatase